MADELYNTYKCIEEAYGEGEFGVSESLSRKFLLTIFSIAFNFLTET